MKEVNLTHFSVLWKEASCNAYDVLGKGFVQVDWFNLSGIYLVFHFAAKKSTASLTLLLCPIIIYPVMT